MYLITTKYGQLNLWPKYSTWDQWIDMHTNMKCTQIIAYIFNQTNSVVYLKVSVEERLWRIITSHRLMHMFFALYRQSLPHFWRFWIKRVPHKGQVMRTCDPFGDKISAQQLCIIYHLTTKCSTKCLPCPAMIKLSRYMLEPWPWFHCCLITMVRYVAWLKTEYNYCIARNYTEKRPLPLI